jgi:hypothetical protein
VCAQQIGVLLPPVELLYLATCRSSVASHEDEVAGVVLALAPRVDAEPGKSLTSALSEVLRDRSHTRVHEVLDLPVPGELI